MSYIFNIFKEFKYQLLLIYFYIFFAQMLFLVEPYVLGKMIDGLLIREYKWLVLFFVVAILENIFFYKRMVFDTKVYTSIYNKVIFKYLKSDRNVNSSTKIARTELAGNIINFLENDVQYFIMSIMSLVGTLFFVFLQDIATGFIVATCVIPIAFIVKILYKKIAQATKVGFNHYEQKVQILTEDNDIKVDTFFKRRRRVLIFGSTLQGKNWFSLNTTKTFFLVLALLVFTSNNINLTQGQAVSMYSYINNFLISLLSIPIGVEVLVRIKDIINRIKSR